ncbi:MAG TPA: hypothetical protein VG759_27180 [Candidatus Angelobacter sp.]|nr:hypothetical protein [Candidatus Angelobacter sp.]
MQSYDQVIDVRSRAEAESEVLESTQQRVADIRRAKERSRTLMDQMSRESFTISELRDSSRRNEVDRLLSQSRLDYEQARRDSSLSVVDWLIIDDILNRSHRQAKEAVVCSQTEPYVPSFSSDTSSSSSTLGSSSFDSSSSSGGFDSGSGSDGSY